MSTADINYIGPECSQVPSLVVLPTQVRMKSDILCITSIPGYLEGCRQGVCAYLCPHQCLVTPLLG